MALSFASPRPGVTRHAARMEFGLSSPTLSSGAITWPARSQRLYHAGRALRADGASPRSPCRPLTCCQSLRRPEIRRPIRGPIPLVLEVLEPLLDVDRSGAGAFRRPGAPRPNRAKKSSGRRPFRRRPGPAARVRGRPSRRSPRPGSLSDATSRDDGVVGARRRGTRTERLPRLEPRPPAGPSKKRIARARVRPRRSAISATRACRSSSVGRAIRRTSPIRLLPSRRYGIVTPSRAARAADA